MLGSSSITWKAAIIGIELLWLSCMSINADESPINIRRKDFPASFLFGASTSATQIEGSALEDGKGPSIWDAFAAIPGKIADGTTPAEGTNSYKNYTNDVNSLKELGVNSYRFSLSWARILPDGTIGGGVNQKAIDYYNKLIDALLENGIKPFVTLYHSDLPQALQEKYGGFLDRAIVNDFKEYSDLCFKTFGDRVKNWITMNEPLILAEFGHELGFAAPGRCSFRCKQGNSSIEPYIVTHNQLLAHATVARLYKEKFQASQGGEIGITLVGRFYEPYSNSAEDKLAVDRAMEFGDGWFMEPFVNGDYPSSMKSLVGDRLPKFTDADKSLVKGAFDFIGINYYSSGYAKDASKAPKANPPSYSTDSLMTETGVDVNGVQLGKVAEGVSWLYDYPQGLEKLLGYFREKYGNPKVYITENGITESNVKDRPLNVALNDPHRIDCIKKHLFHTKAAISKGANVHGYLHWTLADNWEWHSGYTLRFGLYYSDPQDHSKRLPKESAKWYGNFLRGE
ncbi:hypothetical protein SAY87_023296 [Trapa incisa]|uniref:Beta-glucosidase n=1 Tax=Trapa incisa TaxID=236973 RepID=A0AAN7KBQ2_9MYRT|nr:hypothetical protein SAY87_023295 [Trapa incisa]KAK4760165.1 hypothetical protein SAY87_023296 [Trapa incisa]